MHQKKEFISHIFLRKSRKVKLATVVEGKQKAPFSIATTITIGIIIIIIIPFQVFYISVSLGFLIGVWMTTSLLKSPGLFSVFWSISTIL